MRCFLVLNIWNHYRCIGWRDKQEAQGVTYHAPEYHVPPVWRIRQDCHFCLLIGPINTILEEDVRILLSVKFHWIPLSGFRGKVENVSANQRPGRPSCFFWLARKTQKLLEDVEILLPVKFHWMPFRGFRGEEKKTLCWQHVINSM